MRTSFRERALARMLLALCASVLGALAWSGAAAANEIAHGASVGRTSGSAQLQLVLPLKARLGALRTFAEEVSTPGSPLYGKYESIGTLAARFGASKAAKQRTVAYLRRNGATQITLDATGLFVDATMRADTAQRLFATTLEQYRTRDAAGSEYTAPAGGAAIPAALRGAVTGVVGLDTEPVVGSAGSFMRQRAGRAAVAASGQGAKAVFGTLEDSVGSGDATSSGYLPATGVQAGCPEALATHAFTPNQYLTAYNYAPLQAQGLTGAGERVALIEIDGYKQSDIETYAACFGLHLPPIRDFGVGIRHALTPGGETTLDLEVMATAAPQASIDVYESDAEESDALKALTAPLQNKGSKPQVISASLGLCEPFVAGAVGIAGLNNTEGALEEAAAAGISFLDASGDSGSSDCLSESGKPLPQLTVNYPTSSWWVTGVGGTNIALNAANQLTGQRVWNDGDLQPGSAGGGGLSRTFTRPLYQKGTVVKNQRGVPDVSMLGDVAPGYAIYCSAPEACVNSQNPSPWAGVGGTSAATPLLAGGFLMVDQALRQQSHAAIGFANPLLYQVGRSAAAATVFSDVAVGSNDIGPYVFGRALGCCTAVAGWDKASGWGSVNLPGLVNAALASAAQPAVKVSISVPGGQRPVAARRLKAKITTSGPAVVGAYAAIRIGGGKPQRVVSKPATLSRAGSTTVAIAFSAALESRLRAALASGKKVTATVGATAIDEGGQQQHVSTPSSVRITR